MSNIYLKTTIEKNFRFSSLKKFVSRSVFEGLQLKKISLNFKTFRCNLNIRGLKQSRMWFFYYFIFERNWKSKSPCFLLIQTLIKKTQNRKLKIPHTLLERQNLCLCLCKNHKLKVKLWWLGARYKKECIFCNV